MEQLSYPDTGWETALLSVPMFGSVLVRVQKPGKAMDASGNNTIRCPVIGCTT
jgi:hypothetical protein